MNATPGPLLQNDTRLDQLRMRYHAHLASVRSPNGAGGGRDGAREGAVAGKETRRGMRQGALWAKMTEQGWQAFTQAWLQTPENVFFWSDLHLGHENIIRYAERPFGGIHHMDGSLLAQAQAIVLPEQWLLFVGDLAMWKDKSRIQSWMAQCPGRKALVLGNHDLRGRERPQQVEYWQEMGFEAVADVACLPASHGCQELWITHYPLRRQDLDPGTINLHGHTHRHVLGGPFVNACVEILHYRPRNMRDHVIEQLGSQT